MPSHANSEMFRSLGSIDQLICDFESAREIADPLKSGISKG
jgi:hypothetical protein